MDWPGVYHNNGSVVSFVDAHVEFRRWLEEDTKVIPEAVQNPTTIKDLVVSPDNRDIKWLGERATEPYPNNHPWTQVMNGISRYNRPWNTRDASGQRYDSWGWYWNDTWGYHPTWKPMR